MSRKACCYDNAAMESFWSTLKLELVYRHELATRAQARHEIFYYIEAFYNPRRRHSSLGYLSPGDFNSPPPGHDNRKHVFTPPNDVPRFQFSGEPYNERREVLRYEQQLADKGNPEALYASRDSLPSGD